MTTPETIVVDTDVASYVFSRSPKQDRFLPHLQGRIAGLSFVTVGELFRGAYQNNWGSRRLEVMEHFIRTNFVILGPHALLARQWAEIMAKATKSGRPPSANDAWIAASAMVEGCPLLTNDAAFRSVDGLVVLP